MIRILCITLLIPLGIVALWNHLFSTSKPESAVRIALNVDPNSPLAKASLAQVDVSVAHVSPNFRDDPLLELCMSALYQFEDLDGSVSASILNTDNWLPSAVFTGAQVHSYGSAPLRNLPKNLPSGFNVSPEIRLEDVTWSPVPTKRQGDVWTVTLPSFTSYSPDTGPSGTEPPQAFAFASGCYHLIDMNSGKDGLATTTYSLGWGNRSEIPVGKATDSKVPVHWSFVALPGEEVTHTAPRAHENAESLTYTSTFNDNTAIAVSWSSVTEVKLLAGIDWIAVGLGSLVLASFWGLVSGKFQNIQT